MASQKVKKGLLAGTLAVACAFSVAGLAACGANQAENDDKNQPKDETVVVVTPEVISWNVENDKEGVIFVQQLKKVIADWEAEAEQIKNEQIEYYREKSHADDSTAIINETFKTSVVMKANGKVYSVDNDAATLLAIANSADKVEFELSYYFESHGYSIIELNWFKAQNDIHTGSKVVEVVKTATNPTTVVSYK